MPIYGSYAPEMSGNPTGQGAYGYGGTGGMPGVMPGGTMVPSDGVAPPAGTTTGGTAPATPGTTVPPNPVPTPGAGATDTTTPPNPTPAPGGDATTTTTTTGKPGF